MRTKQHMCFCDHCGKITNHVTHYENSDGGSQLIAKVRCVEHTEDVA